MLDPGCQDACHYKFTEERVMFSDMSCNMRIKQLKKTCPNTQNASKLRKHQFYIHNILRRTFLPLAVVVRRFGSKLSQKVLNTHNTSQKALSIQKMTTNVFQKDTIAGIDLDLLAVAMLL